jgi:hypothetical protein
MNRFLAPSVHSSDERIIEIELKSSSIRSNMLLKISVLEQTLVLGIGDLFDAWFENHISRRLLKEWK